MEELGRGNLKIHILLPTHNLSNNDQHRIYIYQNCVYLDQCFLNFCFSTFILLLCIFHSIGSSKIQLVRTIVPDLELFSGPRRTALESTDLDSEYF